MPLPPSHDVSPLFLSLSVQTDHIEAIRWDAAQEHTFPCLHHPLREGAVGFLQKFSGACLTGDRIGEDRAIVRLRQALVFQSRPELNAVLHEFGDELKILICVLKPKAVDRLDDHPSDFP